MGNDFNLERPHEHGILRKSMDILERDSKMFGSKKDDAHDESKEGGGGGRSLDERETSRRSLVSAGAYQISRKGRPSETGQLKGRVKSFEGV